MLSATHAPTERGAEPADTPLTESHIPTPDALAPAFSHLLRGAPYAHTDLDETKHASCQKLLFSATLTRDPSKIAALNLRDPKYFVVQGASHETSTHEDGVLDLVMEKFSMPATLSVRSPSLPDDESQKSITVTAQEHMIISQTSQKPLMLFHLVHAVGLRNALVFTKSAESTTRLVRLFEFFEADRLLKAGADTKIMVHAYSSDLAPSTRKDILDKFKKQEIHMYVSQISSMRRYS